MLWTRRKGRRKSRIPLHCRPRVTMLESNVSLQERERPNSKRRSSSMLVERRWSKQPVQRTLGVGSNQRRSASFRQPATSALRASTATQQTSVPSSAVSPSPLPQFTMSQLQHFLCPLALARRTDLLLSSLETLEPSCYGAIEMQIGNRKRYRSPGGGRRKGCRDLSNRMHSINRETRILSRDMRTTQMPQPQRVSRHTPAGRFHSPPSNLTQL